MNNYVIYKSQLVYKFDSLDYSVKQFINCKKPTIR